MNEPRSIFTRAFLTTLLVFHTITNTQPMAQDPHKSVKAKMLLSTADHQQMGVKVSVGSNQLIIHSRQGVPLKTLSFDQLTKIKYSHSKEPPTQLTKERVTAGTAELGEGGSLTGFAV